MNFDIKFVATEEFFKNVDEGRKFIVMWYIYDREDFKIKSVLFLTVQASNCTGYFMLLLPMSEWADIYCAVGEPAKLGRGLWGGIGQ